MSTTNNEWIGRILNSLKEGLGPFVLHVYKSRFPFLNGAGGGNLINDYITVIHSALGPEWHGGHLQALNTDGQLLGALDAAGWLTLIGHKDHQSMFANSLTQLEINYAHELREYRHKWVYQQPLSHDDAQRAADSAERLLRKIGAWEQAEECAEIRDAVKRDDVSANQGWVIQAPAASSDEFETAGVTQRISIYPDYWINVQTPGEPASSYRMEQERIIIGRSHMNCDIVVEDNLVSRVHLQVVKLREGGLAIMDLHSANGTQIDGKPLRPNFTATWTPEQVVLVGKSEITVLMRQEKPASEQDTNYFLTVDSENTGLNSPI